MVGRDGGAHSMPATTDASWERLAGKAGSTGWARRGLVEVPKALGPPGAVLVTKHDDDAQDGAHRVDYVRGVRLATCVSGQTGVV